MSTWVSSWRRGSARRRQRSWWSQAGPWRAAAGGSIHFHRSRGRRSPDHPHTYSQCNSAHTHTQAHIIIRCKILSKNWIYKLKCGDVSQVWMFLCFLNDVNEEFQTTAHPFPNWRVVSGISYPPCKLLNVCYSAFDFMVLDLLWYCRSDHISQKENRSFQLVKCKPLVCCRDQTLCRCSQRGRETWTLRGWKHRLG